MKVRQPQSRPIPKLTAISVPQSHFLWKREVNSAKEEVDGCFYKDQKITSSFYAEIGKFRIGAQTINQLSISR